MVGILLAGVVAYRQLPGVGAAGSRLSDHSGRDVLSGRESRRDGVIGDRAARAPVRPGARAAADDFGEFRRQFRHHAAIQSEPGHRCRRAGSAAVDQRFRNLSAGRPAGASGLQQDQPGRRAGSDSGADIQGNSAFAGGGSRRYAAGARRFRSCPAWAWSASAGDRSPRCASRRIRRSFPPTA